MLLVTAIPEAGSRAILGALLDAGADVRYVPKIYDGHLSEFPPSSVIFGHHRCRGRLKKLAMVGKLQVVSVIRDPKDVLFSTIDLYRSGHPVDLLRKAPWLARRGKADLLDLLIGGREGLLPPIAAVCSGFIEWAEVGARIIRYETFMAGAMNFPAPVDQVRFRASLVRAARSDRAHRPGTGLRRMDLDMRRLWNERCGELDLYLGYPPAPTDQA